MSFCRILPLIALSSSTVFAEPDAFQQKLSELDADATKLSTAEQNLIAHIMLLEEQTKVKDEHINLLRQRLANLTAKSSLPATLDEAAAAGQFPEMSSEERETKANELISECRDRIVILRAANGKTCTAFVAPHDGIARIFASAPWIAANGKFTLSNLNGNTVSFSQEIDCPTGIGLIALKPEKTDIPVFAIAGEKEVPAVGAGILVVVADAELKGLQGIGGTIRGIGPDTLEIDAELTPEMSGAPVLSLITGKLIGIVAEQITGVEEDWAVGTRHEGSRNFVVRLERARDWRESDLGRFAKEADYISKIREKTRTAWIAHTIMNGEFWHRSRNPYGSSNMVKEPNETKEEFYARVRAWNEFTSEQREERKRARAAWLKEQRRAVNLGTAAREKAVKYPNNPYITRANSWVSQLVKFEVIKSDSEQENNLVSVYRHLLTDLTKKETDLSAHLSPYHKEHYRLALADRAEAIRIVTERVNRVAR